MEYQHPTRLTGDVLKQRIFSPVAYAAVRNVNIVPVAASEAPRFAAFYPIVWRKRSSAFELVVLRSLLTNGRGHPPGTQKTVAFLPVLCRAYPFLYDPASDPSASRAKFVDATIADEPSDIGAPICLVDGRPTKATAQRLALLDAAAPSFAQAVAVTKSLEQLNLFEPWPLHFEDVAGHTIDVDGLWIIKQDTLDTGVFASIMRRHGIVAADLIGLHRISLFRAGILLSQARTDLSTDRQTPVPTPPDRPSSQMPDEAVERAGADA